MFLPSRWPTAPLVVFAAVFAVACSSLTSETEDGSSIAGDEAGGGGAETGGSAETGGGGTDGGGGAADTGGSKDGGGTVDPTWPAASVALEEAILAEVNKRRAAGADCGTEGKFGPAPPLVMHPILTKAARLHSQDMATRSYFSHDTPEGVDPFERMKAAGYKGGMMGENIAAGNATAAKTMEQWMNSDGHCANIMNPKYTQLGVGYFYSATSKFKHYWTQNFGAGG